MVDFRMFTSKQTVTALLLIREWEKSQLPSPKSALGYELFLLIAHHTLAQSPLTLNQLFLSVDYTETAVRRQLGTLINQQWCELVVMDTDKRLKRVIAKKKMLDLKDKYGVLICDLLMDKISSHREYLSKKQ